MPKPEWAQRRWMLNAEAHIWRFLMEIGMSLHRLGPPRPMSSSYTRHICSTLSPAHRGGKIRLVFYVPTSHQQSKKLPVIVNFHGGGMTIGNPEDDATWATATVQQCQCIVVCVGYRLAPTHSFPTPVEDGADAVLYLAKHADELGLDMQRLTISGFSAGGNLCFTVPLKLASLRHPSIEVTSSDHVISDSTMSSAQPSGSDSDFNERAPLRQGDEDAGRGRGYNIICIIAFYPSVNFTTTRAERRGTNTRQDMNMGEFFTDLFDASYLPPGSDMSHPLLSPGAAPPQLLRDGICDDIMFYTAEWDELQAEARAFATVLESLGKRVRYRMMEGQVHAWDRTPNPFKENKLRGVVYREACAALNQILEGRSVHHLEPQGETIDDLHLVDQVNEVTQDYVRDKRLRKEIGADTPDRLQTTDLQALAED